MNYMTCLDFFVVKVPFRNTYKIIFSDMCILADRIMKERTGAILWFPGRRVGRAHWACMPAAGILMRGLAYIWDWLKANDSVSIVHLDRGLSVIDKYSSV